MSALLEVRGVSRFFGGLAALSEVDFEVREELTDGTLRLMVRAVVDGREDDDLLQHLALTCISKPTVG